MKSIFHSIPFGEGARTVTISKRLVLLSLHTTSELTELTEVPFLFVFFNGSLEELSC